MVAQRSVVPIRAVKLGDVVLSTVACAQGIALMASPTLPLAAMTRQLGVYFLAFGVVRLLGYCVRDLFRLAFQYDLAFGVLLMTLGVNLLVRPVHTFGFLGILLGIPLLMDGLLKIQIAIDARAFGLRSWGIILAPALLTSVLGALLMLRLDISPQASTCLMGMALLAEGVTNLCAALLTVKIIRHQKPDTLR